MLGSLKSLGFSSVRVCAHVTSRGVHVEARLAKANIKLLPAAPPKGPPRPSSPRISHPAGLAPGWIREMDKGDG